ncbi:accessory gene regulator B [Anaerovirgula multivorans]|uniref:Accessory gene regulator B n=1 Tax=Anaerovirgula multivorans TaxID=312168 RepID=A0A239KYK6_9FIRM|nr:accessory gene regulator B family protein [Anaerovirgula multivorans]SNT22832.1 accessory gene regulator B [Anaerovirgula multivorans]
MLNQISCYVVNVMKENNIIHDKDFDWYVFGTEVFFITVIKYLVLFILAFILGLFKEAIVFILAFSSLRIQAGGVHSESFWKCLMITNILTFASIFLVKSIPMKYIIILLPILLIFSTILVFKYAPVDTPNKPLDQHEIKKYKKRSTATVMIGSILIIVLVTFFKTSFILNYAAIAAIGFFSEAVTLTPWVTRRKI